MLKHTESHKIRSIEEALAAAGVTEASLSEAERNALDEQGYVILRDVFAADQLQQLREAFDAAAPEASRARATEGKQTGTRHIDNLLARGEIFQRVCFHPRILAAVFHVLQRRFVTQRIHGRDPLPGFGQQGLHMDWITPGGDGHYAVVTAIGMLDEFTAQNGATRVVPGTHRLSVRIDKRTADPAFIHPQQVIITAPAGAVLVFNGHLWHSATRNRSASSRRTLQYSFVGYEYHRMNESASHPEAISPAAGFLMGQY